MSRYGGGTGRALPLCSRDGESAPYGRDKTAGSV